MAERKKRVRKSADSSAKDTKTTKKPASKREQDAKSRAKAAKPKRIRKAAQTATRPVSATRDALTTHYHLTDPSKDSFWHRPRTLTPKYIKSSWEEVRKVTWPSFKDSLRLMLAVFIFAVVMGASIALLDLGLERVMREIIL